MREVSICKSNFIVTSISANQIPISTLKNRLQNCLETSCPIDFEVSQNATFRVDGNIEKRI